MISKLELKAYLKVCLPEVLVKQFEIETFGWVKWMFDEPVSNESRTLLSNQELATLISKMPYGIIGDSNYVHISDF